MKTRPFSSSSHPARRLKPFGTHLRAAASLLTLLAATASLAAQAQAPESILDSTLAPYANAKSNSKKQAARRPEDKDAVQPTIAIPVAPLGFAPPAQYYLGERFAQASLDFLDEDTLLFTFRIPGLIARERVAPDARPLAERHIRALTLSIATGKVTTETVWIVHDYSRYLWPMKDHRFLFRDQNNIKIGDATLNLQPFLRFPGPVTYLELDPAQRFLIADTNEPPAPDSGSASSPLGQPANQPQTASASVVGSHFTQDATSPSSNQNLLRIMSMDTRKVMLFSRVNGAVHLPVDGEGYYESLRGNVNSWVIAFQHFSGQSTPIAQVESSCDPLLDAMTPGVVVASACTSNGARHLFTFARDRDKDHSRLWDLLLPPTKVWPQWAASGDGLRFARSTLEVAHPVGPFSPLDNSDIHGQSVQVYDVANGKIQLTVPASPILDGGGNFALSPSGMRFAVLNSGSIQVYDLPPAPPIPPSPAPTVTATNP
jgi:hypothetical protein